MNLLAHFFLSHQTPALVVGSFLGDFVKGKQYLEYDEAVAQGIRLHRAIDTFTDTHPVFLQSKHRLVAEHRHYAGVVVDIFYDHLLAIRWSQYSSDSLTNFAQHIYQTLQSHQKLLPPSARRAMGYLVQYRWLENYATLPGIEKTLQGLERRVAHPNRMSQAVSALEKDFGLFEKEFQAFFPQLQAYVKHYLADE